MKKLATKSSEEIGIKKEVKKLAATLGISALFLSNMLGLGGCFKKVSGSGKKIAKLSNVSQEDNERYLKVLEEVKKLVSNSEEIEEKMGIYVPEKGLLENVPAYKNWKDTVAEVQEEIDPSFDTLGLSENDELRIEVKKLFDIARKDPKNLSVFVGTWMDKFVELFIEYSKNGDEEGMKETVVMAKLFMNEFFNDFEFGIYEKSIIQIKESQEQGDELRFRISDEYVEAYNNQMKIIEDIDNGYTVKMIGDGNKIAESLVSNYGVTVGNLTQVKENKPEIFAEIMEFDIDNQADKILSDVKKSLVEEELTENDYRVIKEKIKIALKVSYEKRVSVPLKLPSKWVDKKEIVENVKYEKKSWVNFDVNKVISGYLNNFLELEVNGEKIDRGELAGKVKVMSSVDKDEQTDIIEKKIVKVSVGDINYEFLLLQGNEIKGINRNSSGWDEYKENREKARGDMYTFVYLVFSENKFSKNEALIIESSNGENVRVPLVTFTLILGMSILSLKMVGDKGLKKK